MGLDFCTRILCCRVINRVDAIVTGFLSLIIGAVACDVSIQFRCCSRPLQAAEWFDPVTYLTGVHRLGIDRC